MIIQVRMLMCRKVVTILLNSQFPYSAIEKVSYWNNNKHYVIIKKYLNLRFTVTLYHAQEGVGLYVRCSHDNR